MKTKNLSVLFLLVFAGSTSSIQAIPVTFNLRDTGATAEIESSVITRSGVQATLTPIVNGSSGQLNQTGLGFGINASGTDVTDQLDNGDGAESISIIFNQDVRFTGLNLSAFTTTETALLTINGFSTMTLTGMAAADDMYSFSANNFVMAGQTVVLSWGSGNGVSFDSFTVDTVTRSLPESFSGFWGLLGVVVLLVMVCGFSPALHQQPMARAKAGPRETRRPSHPGAPRG